MTVPEQIKDLTALRRPLMLLLLFGILLVAYLVFLVRGSAGQLPGLPDVRQVTPLRVALNQPFSLKVEGQNLDAKLRASLVPDYGNQRMRIGGVPVAGRATSLAYKDQTLYIASMQKGLVVAT